MHDEKTDLTNYSQGQRPTLTASQDYWELEVGGLTSSGKERKKI